MPVATRLSLSTGLSPARRKGSDLHFRSPSGWDEQQVLISDDPLLIPNLMQDRAPMEKDNLVLFLQSQADRYHRESIQRGKGDPVYGPGSRTPAVHQRDRKDERAFCLPSIPSDLVVLTPYRKTGSLPNRDNLPIRRKNLLRHIAHYIVHIIVDAQQLAFAAHSPILDSHRTFVI